MEERISRDLYYLTMAFLVASRSTCPRAQVGFILTGQTSQGSQDLLSTGYNGALSGIPHCGDIGCKMVNGHCVRAVHAELNALLRHQQNNLVYKLIGYSTHYPCWVCLMALQIAGVKEVHYIQEYNDLLIDSEKRELSGIIKLIKHSQQELLKVVTKEYAGIIQGIINGSLKS